MEFVRAEYTTRTSAEEPTVSAITTPENSLLTSRNPLTAAFGYVGLSTYALSTSLLWNSIHPLLLPIIVLGFAGEELKNTALGLITFIGLLIAMVMQPIAGSLSDNVRTRWGRRRPFIIGGTLGAALLFVSLSQANGLLLVLSIYVVLQTIANFASAAYQGLIPDLVPPERRGVASGAKNFAEILGVIVAALAIPLLITEEDLLGGFAGVVAILLLGAAATCVIIREPAMPAGAPRMSAADSVRRTFAVNPREYPDFFWMVAGRLLFVVAMASIQSFSLFYVRDVLRPDDALAAWRDLTAGIGIAILVVSYPAGLLADRVGRIPVILAASVIATSGALLMLTATDSMGVLVFGCLVGVGIGLFLSSNWALATDLIPPGEGARFLGLTNLATAGGAALARLNGPLIDAANGFEPLLGYRLMLLLVGICFAAGGLLVLKVRVPRPGVLLGTT